jgi:hypothetical protein
MVSIKQIKSDIIGPILYQGATRIERSLDLIWDDTLKEFQINGDVVFKNTSNAFNLHLKAGTTANDITYILPITDPTAGQVLTASLPVLGVSTLSWGSAASSTTADNGLTMTLGNVQLGGPLIQDTNIDGVANAWSMTFTNVNLFTANAVSFNLNSQTFVDTYAVGDINDTGANHLGTYSGSYTTVADDITLSSFILTTIDSDIIELQAISSIVLNSTGATTIDSAAGGIIISTNTGGNISLVSVNDALISAAANALSINLYGTPQTNLDGSTDNSMIVTDTVNTKGLIYADDYSALFTDNSLVSKLYVDNFVLGAVTADNGLTASGGNVKLGGVLTQTTIIDGVNTYSFNIIDADINIETSYNRLRMDFSVTALTRIVSVNNFTILDLQDTGGTFGIFDTTLSMNNLYTFDSNGLSIGLNTNQNITDPFGQVGLTNTGLELFWCDGDILTASTISTTGTLYALDPTLVNLTIRSRAGVGVYTTDATGVVQQSIVLSETAQTNPDTSTDNHMVVSDPVFLKGLVYADDYSPLFSDNSLVNKSYVDNLIGGAFTADNGLTMTLGNVQLGGALTQNTDIDGAFTLSIGATTPLADFNITAGNIATFYSLLTFTGTTAQMLQGDSVTGQIGVFDANLTGATMYSSDAIGTNFSRFSIVAVPVALLSSDTSTDNIMIVDDSISSKGLVYINDYSANFTPESLITKRYVDSAVSGNTLATVLTAGNTSGGTDILFTAGSGIDTTATGGTDTLNIGTGNADVINIGRTGATVNIFGTRNFIQTTDLEILDKLIVLNKNGGASTGFGTGFEIEENALITGYFKTNGTADGWLFKAPTSFQFELLSSTLTANRSYTLPNNSGTLITTGNLTDITAVGTIVSGTWNGTIIGTTYGGTGTGTTFTAGSIVFAGASGIYSQDNANFFWDDTNDRLGIKTNAPAKTLHVAGDIRFEPVSGVLLDVESATVNTTNNTTTTIQTIAIPAGAVVMIEARVHSKKTGGAGVGPTGDGNAYIRTVKAKNVGGTVTIGTVSSTFTSEDIGAFNATMAVSGTNIIVQVSGSANNNVTWTSTCIITR